MLDLCSIWFLAQLLVMHCRYGRQMTLVTPSGGNEESKVDCWIALVEHVNMGATASLVTCKLRIDDNIRFWQTESTGHGDIVAGGNL